MNATDTTDRCEACFGIGTEAKMQAVVFGHPIKPMPICPICKGTGKKPKAS